jgi:phosphoglycerate dehydrogenase-like enzyme
MKPVWTLTEPVLMAVARNVGDAAQSIKAGKWERSRLVGVEAKGKTLAIVGLGKGKTAPALSPSSAHTL